MITPEMLEDIFASGGLLEKGMENFEKRDEQLMMAQDVARCYNEDELGVIEAGTGTGKSYAYLSVAILASLEDKEDRTVVATSNVALQQQLINKDIPNLQKALGTDVPYALLLGRGRYVCISKMLGHIARKETSDDLIGDDVSDARKIYQWFRETETGIVEELDHSLLTSSFLQSVRSDKDTCLKQRCPNFQKCFYYSAVAKAKKSSLIVTNHALLFIDSSVRASSNEEYTEDAILPLYNRLVIDECHNIDRSATEFYSVSLNYALAAEVYKKLFQIVHRAQGRQTLGDIVAGFRSDVTVEDAAAFRTDCTSFVGETKIFLENIITERDRKKFSRECLIDDTEIPFDTVQKPRALQLLETLDRIVKALTWFLDASVDEDLEIYKRMGATILSQFRDWGYLLSSFVDHAQHSELVFHYSYDKGNRDVTMTVSPLSVAATLRNNIFGKLETVVCTSATVKAGRDFSYFLSQVGLENQANLVTGFYASPFDYSHNAMLLYPVDGLKFNFAIKGQYAKYLASMLVPVLEMSEGSALVLFTSQEMMNLVYEEVKDRIAQELLVQRRGTSTEKLRSRFRENVSSVLFGLKSFWEGIDVPGEALKVLVVTQLPFGHVEDPIKRARSVDLAKKGGNPFVSIELPEMLISLKQGLGRLIRSESDRGVAIIADGRTARFAELIRSCIPPYYVPEQEYLTLDSFPQRVSDFLYG